MRVAIERAAGILRQARGPALWRRFPWATIIGGAVICLSVAAFQISRHAYQSNLAEHPDEAGHFVSGLCVLDYFRMAPGSNPMRFVEMYYARYPKVALGHWPPVFYIVQAAWYAVAGESPAHAILLAGIATALTALVLFAVLKRLYGSAIALLAAGTFLWLPLVRAGELMLMADMPACLFVLLAVLAFRDLCLFRGRRHWLLFAFWTALAILTKESALTLLAIAPVASLVLFGRSLVTWEKVRWALPACALFVLLLLGSYAVGGVLRIQGLPSLFSVGQAWRHLPLLADFFAGGSPLMLAIGGYGIFGAIRARRRGADPREITVTIALIWLVVTLVSQLFFRDAVEPRYLLPAYLPATILFAEGLFRIAGDLRRHFGRPGLAVPAMALLTALCLISTPPLTMHQRTGYADVAAAIPDDSEGRVVLVSADSSGEGAMVAELLLEDPARTGVVLRATKVLSRSDWLGRNSRLLVRSAESVRQFLDATPVHFIVVDMNGFLRDATRPHHRLLEETLRRYPEQFRLIGDFPLYFDGHRRNHAVQVYENLAVRGRRARTIHIDMSQTIGRDLDLDLTSTHHIARIATVKIGGAPASPDVVPAALSIAPESDSVPARGGAGHVYVTAPPGRSWFVSHVPDWIRVQDGSGMGDGNVDYEVTENRSNRRRSATIAVGDLAFRVTQPRSFITYVPFAAEFTQSELRLGRSSLPTRIPRRTRPRNGFSKTNPGRMFKCGSSENRRCLPMADRRQAGDGDSGLENADLSPGNRSFAAEAVSGGSPDEGRAFRARLAVPAAEDAALPGLRSLRSRPSEHGLEPVRRHLPPVGAGVRSCKQPLRAGGG